MNSHLDAVERNYVRKDLVYDEIKSMIGPGEYVYGKRDFKTSKWVRKSLILDENQAVVHFTIKGRHYIENCTDLIEKVDDVWNFKRNLAIRFENDDVFKKK